MAHGYKEWDFQNRSFLPFLTASPKDGGLGWRRVSGCRLSPVERSTWLLRDDLLRFLSEGCEQNRKAWQKVRRDFGGDQETFEAFLAEALEPKISKYHNTAFVLRENISFRGATFRLWNEPPKAGVPNLDVARRDFEGNFATVVDEIHYERRFPLTGKEFKRRPDAAFFVNGLYLGLCELKVKSTGQTAADEGRRKIASNAVELAKMSLGEARMRWAKSAGVPWPGYDALPAEFRNAIRTECAPFARACHCAAVDSESVYVSVDTDAVLREVDAALSSGDEVRALSEATSNAIRSFGKAPEILGVTGWEAVGEHLSSLYAVEDALDYEIFLYNQNQKARESTVVDIVKPRPAQRIMVYRAMRRVLDLYRHEEEPKITEDAIRKSLRERFGGGFPEAMAEETIRNAMLHRNGTECHSILLQGAAGLGKTKVIVWLARGLAEVVDPRSTASEPLFDRIIILTDRTELRRNIADEANTLRGCQDMVSEALTFADLREGLVNPVRRILTVNIQKFPSIKNLASADPALAKMLAGKRVAIIIDEVHRSQNGTLHDATVELFDEWGGLSKEGSKKNLIIGLTATPKEEILARFGEWEPPSVPGERSVWKPFFSYTMQQAIADGVVLNPIQAVMSFKDVLHFSASAVAEEMGRREVSVSDLSPSVDAIYRNKDRQAMIAKRAAEIFAVNTMNAVRRTGKALFACHSIEAAITMREELVRAIRALADDPRFADRADYLRACPVLLLFSDRQGLPKCSELNDGKSQDAIIDEFRRKGIDGSQDAVKCRNAMLVVVDKLLTGFDEKTLHTIFIDRGMDDVLLFQAACRVNRVAKHKKDCLIVDFSHDGSVSKNLPVVFRKYGALTVSDFDSLTLLEKMDEAYREFFGDAEVSARWKMWSATSQGGKDSRGAMELSAWARTLLVRDPKHAHSLRKALCAWRGCREKLWGVLNFNSPELTKHADEKRAAFAEEVARLLRPERDVDDGETFDPFFVVEQIGEAETWGAPIHGEMGALKSRQEREGKQKSTEGATLTSLSEDGEAREDWLALLQRLQMKEDQKAEAIAKVRNSMLSLFEEIDKMDRDSNQGLHAKQVRDYLMRGRDFPSDSRLDSFDKLFMKAIGQFKYKTNEVEREIVKSFAKRVPLLMADYEEWLRARNKAEWDSSVV